MSTISKFFEEEGCGHAVLQDEEGVTAIEYGLIAALIAVVIIASVRAVGDNLVLVFNAVSTALAGAL